MKSYVISMVFLMGFGVVQTSFADSGNPMLDSACPDGDYSKCAEDALDGVNIEDLIEAQQEKIDEVLDSLDNLDQIDSLANDEQLSELNSLSEQLKTADGELAKDLSMQIGKKLSGNKALFNSVIDKSDLSQQQKEKLKSAHQQGGYQGADAPPAGLTINGIGYIAFSAKMDNLQQQQAKTIRKILGVSANLDEAKQIANKQLNSDTMQQMDEEIKSLPQKLEKVDSNDELKILKNKWNKK